MREDILAAIDAGIANLQQVRTLLTNAVVMERPGSGRLQKSAASTAPEQEKAAAER